MLLWDSCRPHSAVSVWVQMQKAVCPADVAPEEVDLGARELAGAPGCTVEATMLLCTPSRQIELQRRDAGLVTLLA